MLDSLNLQELQDRADNYKRVSQYNRNRALILFLVGSLILFVLWQQLQKPPSQAFVYGEEGWKQTLGGSILVDMDVANHERVWFQTTNPDGFIQWYRHEAHTYDLATVGLDSYENRGDFVARDEVAWAVYDDNVVYFDGNDWTVYEHVLPTSQNIGISVSLNHVLFADQFGTITAFDFETWQDVTPSNFNTSPESTSLHHLGYHYMVSDNELWRYILNEWEITGQIPDAFGTDARLIGGDFPYALGIATSDGFVSYRIDESEWEFFSFADMEMPVGTIIYDVSSSPSSRLVATSAGLWHWNMLGWEQVDSPNTSLPITSVSRNDAHSDVVLATNPDLAASPVLPAFVWVFGHVAIPIAFIVLFLGCFNYWGRPINVLNRARADRAKKLLFRFFPEEEYYENPYGQPASTKRSTFNLVVWVFGFIVFGVIFALFEIPNVMIPILIFFSLWLRSILPYFRRWRQAEGIKEKHHLNRQLWLITPDMGHIIGYRECTLADFY